MGSGVYPISFAFLQMISCVSFFTKALFFRAAPTVEQENPVASAISLSAIRPMRFLFFHLNRTVTNSKVFTKKSFRDTLIS